MFRNKYQALTKLERRAVWIALVIAIFFAVFAGTLVDTLIAAPNPQYALVNVVPFILSLVAFISSGLMIGGRVSAGSWLIQLGTLIGLVVTVTQAEGFGFPSAFIVLAVTLYIPFQTLKGQSASLSLGIGIVGAMGVILLDAFWEGTRVPALEQDVLTAGAISIILALTLAYTTFAQFSGYTFRAKLILVLIIVAVFSVGAVAVVTSVLTRSEISQQVGARQQSLAQRLAFETGKELEAQVEILQAAATQFEELTAAANEEYIGEAAEIVRRILVLDQRWRAATDASALIQNVVGNETADELRELQEAFPSHVELFLTDRYGANIAATNRTSDYYQADEDWWKTAYRLGRGAVYIGQPEFDESSQTYAVNIAIPVSHQGEVAGILRSTLDVTALITNVQQGTLGRTTEIDLRVANNALLTGETLAQNELPGLSAVMGSFGEIPYKGKLSLVSQQRVFSSADSSAKDAVTQLGWSVIVYQDLNEALQPVQQQTRAITLVAVMIAALVGFLGYYASQRLAAPILTLTDVARKISEGDLSIRAQIQTQDEIGGLANAFNRMTSRLRDTLGGLERRVAERTADLELSRLISERRAQDLQAISEVSRTISTEQRLDILLPLITRLVSERFDFYHVGIFFVDPTKQFAVLQAANSEGGKRMLERGHRLEVGLTGIVGAVAQTGKPRIALDVGTDSIYFDNPDLPGTRSEMALPLIFREDTIGILDVQSRKPGAFTESDANTLSILADQIAIAIENARLFGETLQAREEAETLYNQFLRTEWNTFLQQKESVGYRQSIVGGRALQAPVQSEDIRQALENGKVAVFDGKDVKSPSSLAVPIKLRGQTIGVLNIRAPKNRKWLQDEINLAQAISDRLALALDNARLLQESQRRAAKEAKIGEVTARIGASINMRNVLQIAVEELGRALPGAEVVIQFESEKNDGAT